MATFPLGRLRRLWRWLDAKRPIRAPVHPYRAPARTGARPRPRFVVRRRHLVLSLALLLGVVQLVRTAHHLTPRITDGLLLAMCGIGAALAIFRSIGARVVASTAAGMAAVWLARQVPASMMLRLYDARFERLCSQGTRRCNNWSDSRTCIEGHVGLFPVYQVVVDNGKCSIFLEAWPTFFGVDATGVSRRIEAKSSRWEVFTSSPIDD